MQEDNTVQQQIAERVDENKKGMNDPSSSMFYWANLPVDKIGDMLIERVNKYYEYLLTQAKTDLWLRSYNYYFAGDQRVGRIGRGGEQNELALVNINHYRNILKHLQTLTVNQRPAFEPRAINSDLKSQKQTILARGLLDYYLREERAERDLIQAVEFSLVFGEGFVHSPWDAAKGEAIGVDDYQNLVHQGDLSTSAHEPIDVIRDVRLENYHARDWLILRDYVNKYNLMAKYPEFADDISKQSSVVSTKNHYRINTMTTLESDMIPVYRFYHSKTAACSEGRYTLALMDGTVILDGKLPYNHIPIFRCAASDKTGSSLGYTVAYDLMAIQTLIDTLYSVVTTNQEAFGVTNIIAPIGAGIEYTQLAGALNLIQVNPEFVDKIKPLLLLSTPPEIFNTIKMLEQVMETISSVNAVTRGQAPTSDSSGALAALLQSMTIQFNQELQWSYVQVLEDWGTHTVNTLKEYATTPRLATIVGKHNRSELKEFSGEDLEGVNRVAVEAGNPMSKTVSGNLQIGQMLLQAGIIKSADELLQVLNTGSLQPLIEGKTSELLSIKSENEMLSEGNPVPVLITDDHILHILEHKSVAADPMARQDPDIIKNLSDHLNQHVQMLSDPNNANLLKLMGQPSLSSPPAQGQAGAVAGIAGAGNVQQSPDNNANAQVANNQPKQPGAPTNPLTQQKPQLPTSQLPGPPAK